MLSQEVYQRQHIVRLVGLAVINVEKDKITPKEYIRRIIRFEILSRSDFIKDGDPFVVLGNQDVSWYPTGSFKTSEEAFVHVKQKQVEEDGHSDEADDASTFYVFTREGMHVPQPEG